MQIKIFNSFNPSHIQLYNQILDLTKPISDIYPEYPQWFKHKFLLGLKKKERMYIIAKNQDNILTGCVLIKKTPQEKKICTLFVHPKFRRQGLGTQLLKQTLQELGEHPLVTVSGQTLPQLSPLLKKYGFHLSAVKKGNDLKNTEYYFNDPKADAIKNNLIPVLVKRMNQLNQK